jgi:hypothetical protein
VSGALITRAERGDLLKIARLRARVALGEIEQRSAELLADFEQQLASVYSFDTNDVWAVAEAAAEAAVDKAAADIAAECRRLGIPKRFAPGLSLGWYGRGENACAQRRIELRKVAKTRIEALAAGARAAINRASAEIQTELIATGLGDEAKALLDKMPSAKALMAPLAVEEVEKLIGRRGE